MERKTKSYTTITLVMLMLLCLLLLTSCSQKKNFIGSWQTDILDAGNSRDVAADVAGEVTSEALDDYGGSIWGAFASIFAENIHMNATMTINEDGTLVMDTGNNMTFSAEWELDGERIIIDGENIYGYGTLSEDNQTLYFENTVKPEDRPTNTNGLMIGSDSIEFVFKKVED